MRKMKIFGFGLALLAVAAVAQPAQAACGAAYIVSTTLNVAEYSYVINPAVDPETEGFNGSTLSPAVQGFFWGVGIGDPAIGVGADNGAWATPDWLYTLPGYGASILTTWNESPNIDGCIDTQADAGSRCQATFVQDVDPDTGQGLFALVATEDETNGDFYLNQEGNAHIILVPAAQLGILNSTRNGSQGVNVQVSGPTAEGIAAGAYLDNDPACVGAGGGGTDPLNGLITGYKVRYQVLPRGSAPPSNFAASAWVDAGSGVLPLGASGQAAVDCGGADSDVYLTYQLVLDSGFEAPLVSASSTRTECGPNVADPAERIRIAPETRQKPTTRQQR